MLQALRVAVVGAGMISAYHLRAWKKERRADVVALVEPDAGRAAARAAEFGIPRTYRSVEDLLAAEGLDAVDIASPRETHGPILLQAVDRGMAVLCQKPFMPTYEDAREILPRLASARVMVNQNFRFRPYYRTIKRWLDRGDLGELTGLSIACRSSGLLKGPDGRYPYIERQPFVREERRLMIEEVLVHRIDIARWFAGEMKVVAAHVRRSCPELVGESEAAIVFATRDHGMPVVVDGNLASAGYQAVPAHDRVEVIGSRGRIMLDHDVLRLIGDEVEEIRYMHAEVYQESFDVTIQYFTSCIFDGTPFLTDPADNLATLELVESAYRSAGWQASDAR